MSKEMEEIHKLMKEQIEYMFAHNGVRSTDINNRLSILIDEYVNGDLDGDTCLDKLDEVEDVWKGTVLLFYNFAMNEFLDKAVNG